MQKIEHNMTIDVQESPRLTIESENLGYRIKGGDDDKVTIEATIEYEPRHRDQEITIEDIITVENVDNHVHVTIDDPEVRQMKSKILISIPRESALEADSENGSIHIDQVRIASGRVESENGSLHIDDVEGPMELGTENGAVKCQKIRGDLTIETENGSCKVTGCVGGKFRTHTENGSVIGVRMDFDDIDIKTENGKIFYEYLPRETGKASFVTENGKIQMMIPDGVEYDIHAVTDNGRFFIGLDGEYLIKNTNHGKELQKTLGSGKVKIEAVTQNGSILMSNKLLKEKGTAHDHIAEGVQTGMRHALKVVSKVIGSLGGELENVDFGISEEDQQKVMSKIQKVGEKLQKASVRIQKKAEFDQDKLNGLDNLGEELNNLGAELKVKLSGLGKNISESVQKEFSDLQESPEWKTIVKRVKRHKVSETREENKEDQHQSRVQILQMLQEGKLSVEEAERLLKAIEN